MSMEFEELISAPAERLLNVLYPLARLHEADPDRRLARVARRLGMRRAQLLCGIGFNRAARELPDVLSILGCASYEALAQRRNEVFIGDIYQRLSLEHVLAIYTAVRDDDDIVAVLQYLLEQRLENIERRIEATVNALIIERYKREMRAIYSSGIAGIDFAESRLNRIDSGFRALVNEVNIITESRLIPVGDIFFRDTILPEEKRKLILKGLIPEELIRARLDEPALSAQERRMLEDELAAGRSARR